MSVPLPQLHESAAALPWVFRQLRDRGYYAYLLGDRVAQCAWVIDPTPGMAPLIEGMLAEDGLRLQRVMLSRECVLLQAGGAAIEGARTQRLADYADGAGLACGAEPLRVLHTPGVSAQACCLRWRDRLLAGATLPLTACQRPPCEIADPGAYYDSLRRLLYGLAPDILIYPGLASGERGVWTVAEARERCDPWLAAGRDAFCARLARAPSIEESKPQ